MTGILRKPEAGTADLPTLLTADEVATWLKLKPKTVYLMAAKKRLPCVRFGGSLRFDRDVLLRWLAARREER